MLIARCSIYETRPKVCRDYPTIGHYLPDECTYYFAGGERKGECNCGVGACCAIPRVGGEPGGAPMPHVGGGEPCKYLTWVEDEQEKTAESRPSMDTDRGAKALEEVIGQ